jgi:hypothetical protein
VGGKTTGNLVKRDRSDSGSPHPRVPVMPWFAKQGFVSIHVGFLQSQLQW